MVWRNTEITKCYEAIEIGYKRAMVDAAYNDAMVHAGWYEQETTKNS